MKRIFIILASVALFSGCEKYLDIEPKGRVIPSKVEDFQDLLNSGYTVFPAYKDRTAFRSDELSADVSSDDFPAYENIFIWEDVSTTAQTLQYPYISFYQSIFYENETIAGLDKLPVSTSRNQVLAEAYALRAYNYFALINMYASAYNASTATQDKGVPLALFTDLEQTFPRASVEAVYRQILEDITKSEKLMNVSTQAVGENYRFSKQALYALASRVYLYMSDFQNSLQMSDKALSIKSDLVDLNQEGAVMPSAYNSSESILALEEPFSSSLNRASFASAEFVAMFDKQNDLRFPLYFSEDGGQYKVQKSGNAEFKCSFRVAELYLNKAEALVRLGKESQAKALLVTLFEKRYTPAAQQIQKQNIDSLSGDSLLQFVWAERARELAFEGHRWFDLRRTTQPSITHILKGKTYVLQQNDPKYTIVFPKDAVSNNEYLSE